MKRQMKWRQRDFMTDSKQSHFSCLDPHQRRAAGRRSSGLGISCPSSPSSCAAILASLPQIAVLSLNLFCRLWFLRATTTVLPYNMEEDTDSTQQGPWCWERHWLYAAAFSEKRLTSLVGFHDFNNPGNCSLHLQLEFCLTGSVEKGYLTVTSVTSGRCYCPLIAVWIGNTKL